MTLSALFRFHPEIEKSVQKAQSIVGTNNDGGRPIMDFYPTPERGTQALLRVETFIGDIWEPACGDGSMSRAIESFGYKVYSTDIQPRGYGNRLDFFFAGDLLAPNIITNPPFVLSQEFAERALLLGCNKLALLNKLAFLEGVDRTKWLQTTPLKNVWVFSRRLKMTRNGEEERIKGGGMIAFAWFVWEKEYSGRPMIGWV
jgi:hypothetical protein